MNLCHNFACAFSISLTDSEETKTFDLEGPQGIKEETLKERTGDGRVKVCADSVEIENLRCCAPCSCHDPAHAKVERLQRAREREREWKRERESACVCVCV
jgi:hypothetical protein